MGLGNIFEIATDPTFRELSNFITPPRAGKVTAIEGSGQVRVDTDDPDGGDVLAWPLDGLGYAVDDVVYVQFGVNSPDSAVVVGGRNNASSISLIQLTTTGATARFYRNLTATSTDSPVVNIIDDHSGDDQSALRVQQDGTGDVLDLYDGATRVMRVADGGRLDVYSTLRTLSSAGLRIEEAGGVISVFVQDTTGFFGVKNTNPQATLDVIGSSNAARWMAIFAEFGITVENSAVISANQNNAITVQGDGAAYFNARDVTNDIEFLVGTSNAGVVFIGSMTDHPLVFRAGNGAGAGNVEYGQIAKGGNWGFGVTSPLGKLHAYDGVGGCLLISKTGLVGTSVVIIANGTGDVTKTVEFTGVVTNSTPANFSMGFRVDNGSNFNVDDGGGNRLVFTVAASGELSVQRTMGTLTWAFTGLLVWQ